MPFINVKTNQKVSKPQQETIKAGLRKGYHDITGQVRTVADGRH